MPPTSQHEALHRIFLQDEALFARAAAQVLGVIVQEPERVTVLNNDLTTVEPLERRADSVLMAEWLVDDPDGRYILIVESQTDPDGARRRRWPYYIAYLQDKYGCPVVLLVVCSKKATARWARQPIEIGLPDLIVMIVHPVVLGPDNVQATAGQQKWRELMATYLPPVRIRIPPGRHTARSERGSCRGYSADSRPAWRRSR